MCRGYFVPVLIRFFWKGGTRIGPEKIGSLLKKLRNEKGLTQEQFAEMVYEINLRELLDGERKSERMNMELEETVLKAVDYTNSETERYTKRVFWLLSTGALLWFISALISHTSLVENNVMSQISDFSEGAACGMILCGIIATSCYGQRIAAFKQRLLKRQQK